VFDLCQLEYIFLIDLSSFNMILCALWTILSYMASADVTSNIPSSDYGLWSYCYPTPPILQAPFAPTLLPLYLFLDTLPTINFISSTTKGVWLMQTGYMKPCIYFSGEPNCWTAWLCMLYLLT